MMDIEEDQMMYRRTSIRRKHQLASCIPLPRRCMGAFQVAYARANGTEE